MCPTLSSRTSQNPLKTKFTATEKSEVRQIGVHELGLLAVCAADYPRNIDAEASIAALLLPKAPGVVTGDLWFSRRLQEFLWRARQDSNLRPPDS